MPNKINNYAFIDGQNVNLSIQDMGWKLDWRRFRVYLKEKYHVEKAYYFIGFLEENQVLYKSLQEYGYILIFKPTFKGHDGKIKGNCDAELVLQAMIEYPNYYKVLIASGDGDFACLVNYLVEQNKFYRMIIPNKLKYSSLLRKFMPYLDFMNSLKDKLKYIKHKKERH